MKRATTLLIITLMCTSCHIRRNVGEQGQAGYEILEYYAENGIGEDYYPSELRAYDEDRWIMSARHVSGNRTAFFENYNAGKDWEKKSSENEKGLYENICVGTDGRLYCSSPHGFGEDAKPHDRILSSDNAGGSWETLCDFNDDIERLTVNAGGVFVQIFQRTDSNSTHSIIVSDDGCKSWRTLVNYNHLASHFGENIVADITRENGHLIVSINTKTQSLDTIRNNCLTPNQVVAGDDITGIWNGRSAEYYRIVKDTAVYMSRIRYDLPRTSHVPTQIHQCGDIVFTSVLVPSDKSRIEMFISNDRAKSWTQINTNSPFSQEYDSVWTPVGNAWFMVGYKDRMMSYCVGKRNGHRQDFIKILRPKD